MSRWPERVTPFKKRSSAQQQEPSSGTRIAGSLCMFANTLHEGFCLLSCLHRSLLRLNASNPPLSVDDAATPVVTIIYGNDILVNFTAVLLGVSKNKRVLEAYGLDPNVNYLKLWSTGTPESVSGETSILAQPMHFPRIKNQADMLGNPADGGRRTVAYTRNRLFISSHICAENLNMENLGETWKLHRDHLQGKAHCKSERLEMHVSNNRSIMVSVKNFLPFELNEEHAFRVLLSAMQPLPDFVHQVIVENPQVLQAYMREGKNSLLPTMLAIADGFIDEIVDAKDTDMREQEDTTIFMGSDSVVDKPAAAENVTTGFEQPERGPEVTQKWTLSEYNAVAKNRQESLKWRMYALQTISYVFNDHGGQVVPMILHRDPSPQEIMEFIEMHKIIVYLFAEEFGHELSAGGALSLQMRPHKVRRVKNQIVKDCTSNRDALILCTPAANAVDPDEWLCYSYIGGGVPFDPPHGYGLVNKNMTLEAADRFMALTIFSPEHRKASLFRLESGWQCSCRKRGHSRLANSQAK